jgi:hypothetical protein
MVDLPLFEVRSKTVGLGVLPEQQGDKIQPCCGVDPNDCLRFCNKLVQNITMDFPANKSLTQQLTPRWVARGYSFIIHVKAYV